MADTEDKLDNPGGFGTPFSIVLAIFTFVICLSVIVLFVYGCYSYYRGNFIDYDRKLAHSGHTKYIISFFLVPIILQFTGLFALFCRFHKDRSLTTHYAFCIVIMFSCPLSYCVLWLTYVKGWHSWIAMSYVALAAICFSLLPVIIMTYAIMWTRPRESLEDEVTENDIEKWSDFCANLKTDGAALGGYRRRILERLENDLGKALMHANSTTEYEALPKKELVKDLNRILKSRDLHLAINFNNRDIGEEARALLIQGQRKLTNGETQRLHRLLLEASFPSGVLRLCKFNSSSSKLRRLREWIRQRWEESMWNIKDGITKAHFWVLANFFAVFLGVTYLLAFAFAFHDQKRISDKRGPDLYGLDETNAIAGAQRLQAGVAAADNSEPAGRYTFYFDSASARPNLNHEHSMFNEKPFVPSKNSPNKAKDWKESINNSELERLSDDIIALTTQGERLRVEMVGSTDFCDLQASPYSSNYELSQAREQNVKYLLQKRLSQKDRETLGIENERDIDWRTLAVSSEGSPLEERSEYSTDSLNCIKLLKQHGLAKRKIDPSAENKIVKDLENEKQTFNKTIADPEETTRLNLRSEDIKLLMGKIDDLILIVRKEHLSKDKDVAGPLERIKSLAKAMHDRNSKGLSNEEKQRRENFVKRKKVELQESFDAFQYVDDNGAKRVVVVSIHPVKQPGWFTPLSLIDYVYFTTTGSDVIVPTTTFAKFLSSSAKILEVFFLVVFFNVLLSVRGENRLLRSTDKK